MAASMRVLEAVGEATAKRVALSLGGGRGYLGSPGDKSFESQRLFLESQWQEGVEAMTAPAEPEDIRLGLVYLTSWPDLTSVPENIAPSVARVCALLSHKPTVGFLVPKVLDLAEDETRRILQMLQHLGHVRVLQRKTAAESPIEMAAAAEGAALAAETGRGQQHLFLGKLWKRLLSR